MTETVDLGELARDFPGLVAAAAEVIRSPERLSPSAFAAAYRYLKAGTTEKPGRWDPDYFPHAAAVMDAVAEAKAQGYEGLALLKSAQGSGSESMINALAWARANFDGPLLYLISKDEVAKEFGRERFDFLDETCEPLRRQAIRGYGSGANANVRRYAKGKIAVYSGRSVLNFESNPYLIVFVDEIDSLQDVIAGKGDLIKNIKARGKAFRKTPPLIVAFAHPTTKERGVGRLYHQLSDQRRGFVDCPHGCGGSFWLSWDHVQVLPEEGETPEDAERKAERYAYVAPCCGSVLTDSDRWRAVRAGITYRSTLPPEEAARKTWLGIHFSELYYPHVALRDLAAEWIEGIESEAVRRTFTNKTLGEAFEVQAQETTAADWSALVWTPRGEDDPHAYQLGEVPPRVRFLTSGQDSRTTELHWSVWGWGLVRAATGRAELVGWLIDFGVVEREHTPTITASDLLPLDQVLYARAFPRTRAGGRIYVERGYHDSGWCPVAVYEYCRTRPRALPAKGAAEDSASSAPPHRWGASPTWRAANGEEVRDPNLRQALLNTYALKEEFFGLVGRDFELPGGDRHPRLVLPQGVTGDFLQQSSSEYKTRDKTGRRWIWKRRGPNHWSDTNIQAFAAALQLAPFQGGQTNEEAARARAEAGAKARRARARRGDRRIRRQYG